MIPLEGQPILTAAAMRAAEDRAIRAGASVASLMERAGAGVAETVRRLASGAPVLVLCGPGNNGGDGYVAARLLHANGVAVRVAASGPPKTDAAIAARAAWSGPVEDLADAEPGPVLVDALFGTGLTRALDPATEARLAELVTAARFSVAVDLPSGLESDSGAASAHLPHFDLTLALGAPKPAHVLQPAAGHCGAVRILDIGLNLLEQANPDWTMRPPHLSPPHTQAHKYSRGMVVVIGGAMPGAAALAAEAALHAGAGYVLLFTDSDASATPHALVRRRWSRDALAKALDGKRQTATALVIGPGLGHGADPEEKLEAALSSDFPLVIDGDALRMLDDAAFAHIKARSAAAPVTLTPHEGEFKALFGRWTGNKIHAARDAAGRSGATVIFKGPDTVIAHPDGRTTTGLHASSWLSAAGTGDVLAGTVATMLTATQQHPAEAAVWMHTEAARRLGGAFLADDLANNLSVVRASL